MANISEEQLSAAELTSQSISYEETLQAEGLDGKSRNIVVSVRLPEWLVNRLELFSKRTRLSKKSIFTGLLSSLFLSVELKEKGADLGQGMLAAGNPFLVEKKVKIKAKKSSKQNLKKITKKKEEGTKKVD